MHRLKAFSLQSKHPEQLSLITDDFLQIFTTKDFVKQMPDKNSRPSWDRYFMDITALVARRSTCLRRSVGASIVKDKRILSTGYNGAPSGLKHCIEVGCLREKMNVASGERHGFAGEFTPSRML